MKKITAVFLVFALILSLAACGKAPSAKDKVEEFCTALKAFDFAGMQACLEEELDPEGSLAQDEEEIDGIIEYLKGNAAKIEYKVLDNVENGDTANVSMQFEYEDISQTIDDIFTEFFTMLFSGEIDIEEEDDEASAEMMAEMLQKKIEDTPAVRSTADVVFELAKREDGWKITKTPDNLLTVLSGNMEAGVVAAGEKVGEMLEELFSGEGWTSGSYEPVEYPIRNELLFDNEYASMTIENGGTDEFGYIRFSILCENKTDKDMVFRLADVCVNGWLISSTFWETVGAGETLSSEFSLYGMAMDLLGIDSADKVQMTVEAYDEDAWEKEDYAYVGHATVYPTGLSDAQVVVPERPAGSDEAVLLDGEDYSFVILGPREESVWDFEVLFYARNDSDQDLNFSSDEMTINGEELYYGFGMDLPAGCQGIDSFGFDFEDLEAEIDSVEEIRFLLSVREAGNWESEPLFSEAFSY